MNIVQIDNWHEYARDGEQFLNTARAAYSKNKKTFTNEALYNLVCMGIEKLIMAFLMKHGDLAQNHTMADLLDALEKHLGCQPRLATDLLYLNSFQNICDLDTYQSRVPDQLAMQRIIAISRTTQQVLKHHLHLDQRSAETTQ